MMDDMASVISLTLPQWTVPAPLQTRRAPWCSGASSISKQSEKAVHLYFQARSSTRFELGFHRFNLHRPTLG